MSIGIAGVAAVGFGSAWEFILPTIVTLVTMTAGTMFAVWLGELITEQGIGQGLSIIIFGGIVARIPSNLARLLAATKASPGSGHCWRLSSLRS